MTILSFKRLFIGLLGLAAVAAAPAHARTEVTPYLEVQQVLTADLNGGDVLTYTALAGGVDASVRTRRVEAQISYRYERRIGWNDDPIDDEVHSGIARARAEIVPDTLYLEGGALAARARGDGAGPLFGFSSANDPNVAEVYSAYAGPSLSTRVGDLDINGHYRLGYVHVDDRSLAGDPTTRPDRYNSATNHSAEISVGMAPGILPVGWTVGAGYVREDVDRLSQRFEDKYVRGDVIVPVGHDLALTAGIGYEEIKSGQSDILRNADGTPAISPGGNLIEDRSRPRLLAYDQGGLIWDVGVIYRPDRRTELQARVGERYGSTMVVGAFRHQFNGNATLAINVYDGISSFGRLVTTGLVGVPTNFQVENNFLNPGLGGIGGCVFGEEAGGGICFDDAFRTINAANFRNRGANLILSGERGLWSYNLGAGYAHRKYRAPRITGVVTLDDVVDEAFTVQAGLGRRLTPSSGIDLDAYATWYDTGLTGVDSSFGSGVTASYYRRFLLDRLRAQAALGLYTVNSGPLDSSYVSGLVGLRYTF